MKIVKHPYLEGVLCREDGCIFVPANGTNKGHWTFGNRDKDGYRVVGIARKQHKVHRLICETFHGLQPADKPEVDHINRIPWDNRPINIRWTDRKGNEDNKERVDRALEKYGVRRCNDVAGYHRARYAVDPEYRERHKAGMRERYANDPEKRKKDRERQRALNAKKKAEGLVRRKGPNGKWGWYPKISTTNQKGE